MTAVWLGHSLTAVGEVLPAAQEMFDRGQWHPGATREAEAFTKGATDDYLGTLRSFLPEELAGLLRGEGLFVERVGGLGSLSLLAGTEAVRRACADADLLERFIELADRFDREIMPQGPGTRQRAGLIAVAHRA
jgi:hypothetical protein